MEHHLERKVILSEESEFKNLYPWFLREIIDDEGKKVGRDQVPWPWTAWFSLSDIALFSSLGAHKYSKRDESVLSDVRDRTFIRATLAPSKRHPTTPAFSMFGTGREIMDFQLVVYQIGEEEEEKCAAWGSVSYTAEIDFRDETVDDSICFNVHVKAARFARLAQQIADRSLTGGTFRVNGVDGFYSDWSPGVSAWHIKVLTSDVSHHVVEVPEGCSIEPSRMAKVEEFDLTLWRETKFQVLRDEDAEKIRAPVGEGFEQVSQFRILPVADPATVALLRSVRLAAWIIAGGLVIIVIKLVL